MSRVASELADLTPKQRAILEMRLKRKRADGVPLRIPRLSRDSNTFPLSFAQQRLWFIDQLEPGSAFYNAPAALKFKGQLNVETLEQALKEIVRRHESLHTRFSVVGGQPVQIIDPSLSVTLRVVDLRGMSESERRSEVLKLIRLEADTPFDITKGPLLRACLLPLLDDEYILHLTMHHIISDGWSLAIFLHELTLLYRSCESGEPPTLPELEVQYADYAVWQRNYLRGEVLQTQLSYWREQLAGAPSVLELPTDYPRRPMQSFRGASRPFTFSKGLTDELKHLSQREGVTLFMSLLAAFDVLLWRYSGQRDIVVGTPIAGRNQAEIEKVIGFFANTLVLRVRVQEDESYRELLGRVREVTLGAYAHQDVPFERLVEEMHPKRDLSHHPLFQIMFVIHNPVPQMTAAPGSNLTVHRAETGLTKFDLTLLVVETEQGLEGSFEYNTDMFDAAVIERMAEQFKTFVENAVVEPDRALAELSLSTASERRQLLVEWNGRKTEYPREQSLQQLFEEQVGRAPKATAVICGQDVLTYAALNARANQLARHLRASGVGAEVPVGVCMERSAEVVVGLLAILKAGGVYVPLDPGNPPERLAYMLENTRAPVLLTQQRLLPKLPEHTARVVCVDADRAAIARQSDANLDDRTLADNLAYVIYTSGSTGRPKGVCISHRAAVGHFSVIREEFELTPDDRVLQFASFSFDVSLEQILPTLLSGACIVLRGAELWSASDFYEQARELKLTVANLPTSFWHQVVSEEKANAGGAACEQLRLLIIGGDTMLPDSVQLRQRADGQSLRLLNAYGPTETTVTSTVFEVPQSFSERPRARVPIGRPLANRAIYVLDKNGGLAPVGAAGELCIGGDFLARGYLEEPELTAEKFIPDPFSRQPGARLYRTGDLVRRLPDGTLDFLSRLDHQLKVRGFRIEPAEVESALRAHPLVREAVVVASEDSGAGRLLHAYLVAANTRGGGPALTPSGLRSHLSSQLPDYMIPSSFTFLEELPLTPSGKVDRRALPAPDRERGGAGHVGPRTPVEEILSGLWAEVLGVERVGRDDDFFELGGHSLLATQLASRLRQSFGVEVALRRIFERPTVAALAECVEERLRAGTGLPAEAIKPTPRDGDLPLSFAQQRLWFLDQLEPASPAYNVPLAIRLTGELNVPALEESLREVIRRHEALRTAFEMKDGEPVQLISDDVEFALPIEDLSQEGEERREGELRRLMSEEAQTGFDLRRAPLLRARLVRLGDEEQVLLLTLHHIVSDGWSMGVLVREVGALYAAYSRGEASPLPELEVQYADYAVWQREYLQGEVLEEQLSYWREQLAGAPPVLELPTDHARPPVQSFRGARQGFSLEQGLTERLKGLSRREGATLFMTLLAAFYALLYRYSGQSDIVVGSPVAGRDRAEIEGLIGFFVNTLALRVQVEGGESFRELLRRVREVCLGAYGHQGVPFERLVEEVASGREMSHTPLFQVVFALQNVPRGEAELGGVSLRMEAADNQTSKFDLVLMMEESEQGLYGSLEYNTDLFEAATIERMLRHFKMLLSGIASNAEQPVAALPMLTEAERNYLLSEWNATESHYPREKSINRLFEERAAQMPGAVALVSEDEQVSYEELNRRANQLARYLRRLGVSAEVPVGICVERGVELIVGLLAILKAGGAYVPLDPYFPQQRLSFMLKDSGAAVLLTQESLLDRLPECSARRFCLDADWGLSAQESEEDLVGGAGAENLAYIIYTSGSTGNPKGACITHRAVNRLVINTDYVDLRPSDKVAQASNASFDAATFEIWGALLSGAQLIMIKRETALSPQAFAAQLKNDGITVLFLTTALFNQIVRERPEAFATLRHLFFGGERVDTHSVRLMLKGGAPEHLRHVYGPTETTTFATSYPIRHVPDGANTIPIGRPIANTQVYILDRGLEPVASGVAGELYIGGDGLQRCYLNQAELTAEKLIPNPFGDAAGSRLYKTGDLARHLPDGEIEFLGRLDNQVKLRGFRVELGEIESALSNHPFVRENVVVLREDGSGDKRLVAYVAPQPESSLTAMQLRSYLKGQLPDYMIPSSFTLLDRLPLNANGKVDRRALPEPDEQRPQVAAEYVGARTVVEEVLAGLWAEVLGVKEVGVNDNFFELGGHSLMATQLVSKLRNTFHIELPLRLLFESPNVAELAQTLIKHEAKPGLTEKIALAVKKIKSMSPEDKQETLKRLRESKG